MGKTPIFGICLGHQLVGLALGGRTYKLKFGHHGGNHPVKQLETGKIEITAHNHNFAVDPDSLKESEVLKTHIDLNDNTLEGLRHRTLPLFTVQYHPEASPGPHDSHYLFKDFMGLMEEWKKEMPRCNDIAKILIVGSIARAMVVSSAPVSIARACLFSFRLRCSRIFQFPRHRKPWINTYSRNPGGSLRRRRTTSRNAAAKRKPVLTLVTSRDGVAEIKNLDKGRYMVETKGPGRGAGYMHCRR